MSPTREFFIFAFINRKQKKKKTVQSCQTWAEVCGPGGALDSPPTSPTPPKGRVVRVCPLNNDIWGISAGCRGKQRLVEDTYTQNVIVYLNGTGAVSPWPFIPSRTIRGLDEGASGVLNSRATREASATGEVGRRRSIWKCSTGWHLFGALLL